MQLLRVLIVDDLRDAADSMAVLLKLLGYEVRVAYDGPLAVEVAREFRPDAVLLDLGLPGLSGYEVAQRVRAVPGLEQTFLVALTGYGQEEDRRRTTQAGFDAHLLKPADLKTLQSLLAQGCQIAVVA